MPTPMLPISNLDRVFPSAHGLGLAACIHDAKVLPTRQSSRRPETVGGRVQIMSMSNWQNGSTSHLPPLVTYHDGQITAHKRTVARSLLRGRRSEDRCKVCISDGAIRRAHLKWHGAFGRRLGARVAGTRRERQTVSRRVIPMKSVSARLLKKETRPTFGTK